MAVTLSKRTVKSRYVGLDIYRARKKIMRDFPQVDEKKIDIHYVESLYPRFTVLKSAYNEDSGLIELEAASGNPLRHLPSNYQGNEFLRSFLMIFQHVMNDTTITLDNMHEYFRPMESPANFLPVLADWLGIHLDTLGGEDEVRRFLQYAIPLYRYRGTTLGLRAHLTIVCGVVPEITEGVAPYSAMMIDTATETESSLMDSDDSKNSFIIHFPVLRNKFPETLIQRLSLIVQREKPVHTRAYITFETAKKKQRVITVIDTDTVMGMDGGINF
ncbi:MAG: phage tail protein [Treponema sp.]|jgi:phage tail-like protein|nr:phage tail protein [Treponema sp.]